MTTRKNKKDEHERGGIVFEEWRTKTIIPWTRERDGDWTTL